MDAPQEFELIGGDRGAQGGDRGPEARLRERDHVHVALGHEERLALARRLPRGPVVVERPALVEKLGLGRVEVFRAVGRVHRPAAEGDAAAARVADRKDDAVAEDVVGGAALVGGLHEPCGEHELRRHALSREVIRKPAPARRREADLPALAGLGREAAAREVVARGRGGGGLELEPEMAESLLHDPGELALAVELLLRLRVARGHRHAGLAGEKLHRLHEAEVLRLLHELEDVAACMAAEAMVIALAVVDMEGGRLLLVEGARRPEVAAAGIRLPPVPRDLPPHHLAERGPGAEFVEKAGRETHPRNIRPFAAGVESPATGFFRGKALPPEAAARPRAAPLRAPARRYSSSQHRGDGRRSRPWSGRP
jgi:hypothetical protein